MTGFFYCLYCTEGGKKDALVQKDGTCSSCGRQIEFENSYKFVIKYEGSLTGGTIAKILDRSLETYELLDKEVRKIVKDAENGIEESVSEEVDTNIYLPFRENPGFTTRINYDSRDEKYSKLFLATGLSFFDQEFELNFVDPVTNPGSKFNNNWALNSKSFRTRFINIAYEASDPVFSEFDKGKNGIYKTKKNRVDLKKFPESIVEEIKSTKELPEILLPFLDFLKAGDKDSLESTLNHEMTHAYIRHSTDYDQDKKYLRAVEEAACWSVNYVRTDSKINPDISYYRNKGFPKALFQTSIKLFTDHADSINASEEEKISEIRKHAVKAIQKSENEHPLKALAGELDPEMDNIYSSLKKLETAEYYCFHAFSLLGVMKPPSDLKEWAHDLERDSSPYRKEGNKLKTPIEKNQEPLMYKHVEEMKKAVKEIENSEDAGSLEPVKNDLEKFLEVFEEEKNYFNQISDREWSSLEKNVKQMVETSNSVQHLIKKDDQEIFREIEALKEKTIKIVETSLEFNKALLTVLESLHSDEGKLAEVIRDENKSTLKKLKQDTEEEYQVFQRTRKGLEKGLSLLQEIEHEK